jgi:hypothetical protein
MKEEETQTTDLSSSSAAHASGKTQRNMTEEGIREKAPSSSEFLFPQSVP